jgi:hypothetical protein
MAGMSTKALAGGQALDPLAPIARRISDAYDRAKAGLQQFGEAHKVEGVARVNLLLTMIRQGHHSPCSRAPSNERHPHLRAQPTRGHCVLHHQFIHRFSSC